MNNGESLINAGLERDSFRYFNAWIIGYIQRHVEKAWSHDIGTHWCHKVLYKDIFYIRRTTMHFDETVAREVLDQFKSTRG